MYRFVHFLFHDVLTPVIITGLILVAIWNLYDLARWLLTR
jgi:hypothetical protein